MDVFTAIIVVVISVLVSGDVIRVTSAPNPNPAENGLWQRTTTTTAFPPRATGFIGEAATTARSPHIVSGDHKTAAEVSRGI